MKFIRQNKESTQIINLELCRNIYKHSIDFEIVFQFGDTHKAVWEYDTKEERDREFQDICSFFEFMVAL